MNDRWPVLQDLLRENGFAELADAFPIDMPYDRVVGFAKAAQLAVNTVDLAEFSDRDNWDNAQCPDCGVTDDGRALHNVNCDIAKVLRTADPKWARTELERAHAAAVRSEINREAYRNSKRRKNPMQHARFARMPR